MAPSVHGSNANELRRSERKPRPSSVQDSNAMWIVTGCSICNRTPLLQALGVSSATAALIPTIGICIGIEPGSSDATVGSKQTPAKPAASRRTITTKVSLYLYRTLEATPSIPVHCVHYRIPILTPPLNPRMNTLNCTQLGSYQGKPTAKADHHSALAFLNGT